MHTASLHHLQRSAPDTPSQRINPVLFVALAVIDIAIWVHLVLIVAGF